MKNRLRLTTYITLGLIFFVYCARSSQEKKGEHSLSGRILNGYRLINLDEYMDDMRLFVHRGDYIRFISQYYQGDLQIPDLGVLIEISNKSDESHTVKMKNTGRYALKFGDKSGSISVIEYSDIHYSELTTQEAAEFVRDYSPLILDVRTPGEFRSGYIRDAMLIPVQEISTRMDEIVQYKSVPILVYCRSGNRSTVASQILVQHGFTQVNNLRHGIIDWKRKGYEIIR